MQLVSLSYRVFCVIVVFLLVLSPATRANWAVWGLEPQHMVNDTVIMRSASPSSQNKPKQASVVSRSNQSIVRFFEITAYSPTVAECDASPLITASGQRVKVGGIAADLSVLPFGSLVIIPRYNDDKPCEVIDTGGAIKGNKLDVFLWSAHEAVHWGRQKNVPVTILRVGHGD